eukprot:1633460-Amphidinium_carterae.1
MNPHSRGIEGFPTIKHGDPSSLEAYEGARNGKCSIMVMRVAPQWPRWHQVPCCWMFPRI